MRHAIPHDYNSIDQRKMQEENAGNIDKIFTMCASEVNAGEIDKSFTMYADWVNDAKVLAETNFAHIKENGRAFKALPFQALSCHNT